MVNYGGTVSKPANPEKDGYIFDKWWVEVEHNNEFDFTTFTMPDNAVTIYATWTLNHYTMYFNTNGGNAIGSITQDYNTDITQPTEPTKEGHTFAGWFSDMGLTTSYTAWKMPANDITIYAKWTVNNYFVKVKVNTIGYGTVDNVSEITIENVPYGTSYSADGNKLTIEILPKRVINAVKANDTIEYTYTFVNWSSGEGTTGIATEIIANFERAKNKYDVTIKVNNDEAGKVGGQTQLVIQDVPYGTEFTTDGQALTIAGFALVNATVNDATAKYTFSWDKWVDASGQTGQNTIITAHFKATVNTYTVKISSNNIDYGAVNKDKIENVPYGTELLATGNTMTINGIEVTASTTPDTDEFRYKLTGWTNGGTTVEGDTDIVVLFTREVKKYTVTWKNYDNAVIKTENIEYGQTPSYTGDTPVRAKTQQYSYTFKDWSPAITVVKTNQEYKATYTGTVNKYSVVWKNEDGNVLKAELVEYGQTPTYTGSTPAKTKTAKYEYTFTGWTPEVTTVVDSQRYTATFSAEVRKYNVYILSSDERYGTVCTPCVYNVTYGTRMMTAGNVLQVNGSSVTATPKGSDAEGTCTFECWTNGDLEVTEDVTVTARFGRVLNKYTITFENEDGTILQETGIKYGTVPQYEGDSPVKTNANGYIYYFAGWTPEIEAVTGDRVYTAEYNRRVRVIEADAVENDNKPAKPEDESQIPGKAESEIGFEEDTNLVIKVVALAKVDSNIKAPKGKDVVQVFNIKLYRNGEEVKPTSDINITMDMLPELFEYVQDRKNLSIVMLEDEKLVEKAVSSESGQLIFTISETGDLMVVRPATRYYSWFWIILLILAIIIAVEIIYIIISNKKKRMERLVEEKYLTSDEKKIAKGMASQKNAYNYVKRMRI